VAGSNADLHRPLIYPGDSGCDEIREVWKGMIDRRLALIARSAGDRPLEQKRFCRDLG
jgi:hypothetical protein